VRDIFIRDWQQLEQLGDIVGSVVKDGQDAVMHYEGRTY
jgi:hypothetical protein